MPPIAAQTTTNILDPGKDPRGETDLTVCSQNLKNYGSYADSKSKDSKLTEGLYQDKERDLARRFVYAECDVIAVQELLGKTSEIAQVALERMAGRLRQITNRGFTAIAGPSSEGKLTLGFLVANDRAEILNNVSYDKVALPRLVEKQKPRPFTRPPFEIQITSRSKETKLSKTISLVNIHFKSQRGGQQDPTGLEWETYRMEMAEAVRRIVERRHARAFASGETILMVLGDRNSNFDVASNRVLEGSLPLTVFQKEAPCRLSKRGMPVCKAGSAVPQRLFSVLTGDPRTLKYPGTFVYESEYSWLDDILMPSENLSLAWRDATSEGQYASGVQYNPPDASDHALVYVRLNW